MTGSDFVGTAPAPAEITPRTAGYMAEYGAGCFGCPHRTDLSDAERQLPTRQELRDMRSLRKEIEEARTHLMSIDTESAASSRYFSETYLALLRENLEALTKTYERLQRFINGIEDSRTRRVFSMHYIYGWSWQKIAFAIGSSSESTPRLLHSRYLERLP